MRAYGVIILIISKNHTSITGILNTGKLPTKFAYPFSARYDETFLTSSNQGIKSAIRVTHTIAISHDGSDFVSLGRN